MKIGIVGYPTFGGSGVVATELGKALAKKGHKVHFISYSQPVRMDTSGKNLYFHEVNIVKYPLFEYPPYELALISKLVDLINHEELDILHVHYAIPHAFAAYMAKTMLAEGGYNIPIVTTLHGTDITLVGKDPTYETAVTYSINHSDAVTTVSDFLKTSTLELFNITRNIDVIPNFIDLKTFSENEVKEDALSFEEEGKRVITHISNFRKVKRVEDVVRAFAQIREEIPSTLLMVGDGPERARAEMICRELKFCDDVYFVGKRDNVATILNQSDLFMLPSETESFGLAALEAMACEVPVISSDAGGLPELNINGETGFTCTVGDIQDIAEKTKTILANDESLSQFKANAYERAKSFEISKIMPLYESLYEKLLNKSISNPKEEEF